MCVKRCELPWMFRADQDPRAMPEHLRGPVQKITAPDSRRDECPRREGEFADSPDREEVIT